MNSNSPSSSPPVRLRRIAEIVIVLVIIGLLIGFLPRWLHRRQLVADTRADSIPTVDVVSPVAAKADLGTPLPAEVQAFVQAAIHARASGYLKNWFVDIGETVTNGQVLAEIDTPELDQQIAQAKAELDQAQAALDLAKTTADRWTNLLKTASARANFQRLNDLKKFDLVTAPFDGTVTLRNTDIGQLIAADSGPELFRVAQTNPLRVYVRVPQPFVHVIAPGQKAELTFQELPGRVFDAQVTRTAGAVEPSSRTLLVELQVPNPRGEILAGSYAQVRFTEVAEAHGLTLADNALVFRAQGSQVAVVGSDNKVQMRSIKIGRDFGSFVEILSGLDANDRAIVNPPDSIADGMTVQIAPPATTNSVP